MRMMKNEDTVGVAQGKFWNLESKAKTSIQNAHIVKQKKNQKKKFIHKLSFSGDMIKIKKCNKSEKLKLGLAD